MPLLLKLFEAERTSDIGNRRQVVAITGAGCGIGRATALLLAEQGAKLVFDARRADRLEAVTAEIGPISLLDDLRVDDWDEMIDVNIERVLYGIATAFACIPEAVFRRFVAIASTAGSITKPTMAVYSGPKSALCPISEGLRQEAGDKLRMTIIMPLCRPHGVCGFDNGPRRKGTDYLYRGGDGDPAGATPRVIASRSGSYRMSMCPRSWFGPRRSFSSGIGSGPCRAKRP